MRDIVNGLLVRQGEILLAHRSRTRARYPDTWSFPGGHVEDGESLPKALRRELAEELGIRVEAWRKLDRFAHSTDGARFHVFAVTAWRGEPRNLGQEHEELRWVDLRDAHRFPKLTFPIYADIFKALAAG